MARRRDDPRLYWFSPDPRAVLPLESFHLSRRLARTVRGQNFTVTIDTAFPQVLAACAAPRASEGESWINGPLRQLYTQLWQRGCAHSVECWLHPNPSSSRSGSTRTSVDGRGAEESSDVPSRPHPCPPPIGEGDVWGSGNSQQPETSNQQPTLVGGLYGVSLGGAFFGESMFSTARDASKVALVYLVEILRQAGYGLLDVQYPTAHLAQFGVVEISREDYLARLESALRLSPNPSMSFSRASASVIRTSPSGFSVMRSSDSAISNSESSPTAPPESR